MRSLLATVIALAAMSAIAAEPLPKNADDAHCLRGWSERILAWNRATTVDAYGAVGAKDPAWDAAAQRCLERWAAFFSGRSDVPLADLTREADHVVDAGCGDPLVLYLAGRGHQMQGRPAEAEPLLERAEPAFAAHAYPAARLAMCRRRIVECRLALLGVDPRQATPEQLAPLEPLVDSAIAAEVATVTDKAYAGMERLLYEHLADQRYPIDGWQERRDAALERACAGAGVDAWFAKAWLAQREIDLAWRARGSGYANTVTQEGWKGFKEHIGNARTLLEEASRLRADDPIAPTTMITVVMASSGDLRAWFDRAVHAQFDYVPAYSGLRYALMPRWGGSHEQMLALGEECIATGRFDTEVPWQYVETVFDVIGWDHAKDPKTVLGQESVNAALHRALDGYRARAEKDGDARKALWMRSLAVAADYGAGRVDEAAKERRALGDQLLQQAFGRFRLDARAALADLDAEPAEDKKPDF